MIDIASLKDLIKTDTDNIIMILEESDFYNITEMSGGSEVRASLHEGGSLKVKVDIDNLGSVIFGTDISGDIITLVQHQLDLNLRDSINHICQILGVTNSEIEKYKPKSNPFGSFFDNINNDGVSKEDLELTILDEDSVFKNILVKPSQLFLDDGVSYEQQERFKIGFDYFTNRVCIPYRDSVGNLVGIEGRLNKKELKCGDIKYYPIYRYPKTQVLFGYYENYNDLLKNRVIIIVESAKSVMKLSDMGYNYGVAVGKCHISKYQEDLIRSINPKLVIIAFDEDVSNEDLHNMSTSLKANNPYLNMNVGYIKDFDNIYMKKGSKVSPVDLGKKVFDKLIKNMVHYV